jgi:hypothetical protein
VDPVAGLGLSIGGRVILRLIGDEFEGLPLGLGIDPERKGGDPAVDQAHEVGGGYARLPIP